MVLSNAKDSLQQSIQSVRVQSQSKKLKPLLTWRLQNLNLRQNFYKESEQFFHEGVFWKLFVQKLDDKWVEIGVKYAQDFSRESLVKDDQVIFDKYSVISLLNWSRLTHEKSLS